MGAAKRKANDFSSTTWRKALARYATLIMKTLGDDLSALADTGIPLAGDQYTSIAMSDEASALGNGATTPPTGLPTTFNVEDDERLGDWYYKGHCYPLLISAPFGSGKSVLLAYLACGMAERLAEWCGQPEKEMPPVPLPVRLRAWSGEETFEQFVETEALRHVLSAGQRDWLNADQIHALNQAGKLVPLLDGLDELPETAKRRGVTVRPRAEALADIWRLFPEHHVVTSRPGHGAERRGYAGGMLTIGELTPWQAEGAAARILGISEKEYEHPLRQRFAADNDRLDRLLCRPLMLAAWCDHAPRQPRSPNAPTPAALMSVLLEKLLDHRIADHQQSDAHELRDTLLRERHFLGAVLAAHVVEGFGVVSDPPKAALDNGKVFGLSADMVRQFMRHALRAGLLSPSAGGTFVSKIPITEYLIGHYYAWLGTQGDDGCRVLADHFSRQCRLPEFESVWRHCFEELWGGTSVQIDVAANLINWMLNLGAACVEAAKWTADCEAGRDADCSPPAYDRLALTILLPNPDHVKPELKAALTTLVERAMGLWQARQALMWQHLRSCDLFDGKEANAHFDALLRRHPRRLINWVLNCLENPSYSDLYHSLLSALTRSWRLVNDDQLDRLLPVARESRYERAWGCAAPSIRSVSLSMGGLDRGAVQRMLRNGDSGHFESVRDYMAKRAAKLSIKEAMEEAQSLFAELDEGGNLLTTRELINISASLSDLAPRLPLSDAVKLLDAVGAQRDEYVRANFAIAVARTRLRPSADVVRILLKYFDDSLYELARGGLALAIANADQLLDIDVARRFVNILFDEDDPTYWNRVSDALARAQLDADAAAFVREALIAAVKAGRLSAARRLLGSVPGIVVFVGNVEKRMMWDAACAGEKALMLPLRFAPPELRRLISPEAVALLPKVRGDGTWLLTAAVIRTIAAGIAVHLPDKLAAFESRWLLPAGEDGKRDKRTSTRDRRLREVLRLICTSWPEPQQHDFCRRGSLRGMEALRPPGAADASQGKRLEVNATLLSDSLHGSRGAELARQVYERVAGGDSGQGQANELADPVFCCPSCGRLFPVLDTSAASLAGLPKKCDVCGGKLRFAATNAGEMPAAANTRQCAARDDLWFRAVPAAGQDWPYSLRMALPDACPCPDCRRAKRRWRAGPKPKRLH